MFSRYLLFLLAGVPLALLCLPVVDGDVVAAPQGLLTAEDRTRLASAGEAVLSTSSIAQLFERAADDQQKLEAFRQAYQAGQQVAGGSLNDALFQDALQVRGQEIRLLDRIRRGLCSTADVIEYEKSPDPAKNPTLRQVAANVKVVLAQAEARRMVIRECVSRAITTKDLSDLAITGQGQCNAALTRLNPVVFPALPVFGEMQRSLESVRASWKSTDEIFTRMKDANLPGERLAVLGDCALNYSGVDGPIRALAQLAASALCVREFPIEKFPLEATVLLNGIETDRSKLRIKQKGKETWVSLAGKDMDEFRYDAVKKSGEILAVEVKTNTNEAEYSASSVDLKPTRLSTASHRYNSLRAVVMAPTGRASWTMKHRGQLEDQLARITVRDGELRPELARLIDFVRILISPKYRTIFFSS